MENDAYAATVYDLLYYNAEYYQSEAPEQLDAFYTSQAVTTMRSDFTDPNGSFLGFKGGQNGAAHGDIDIGSFVYDMFGERWAFDFGKEDYNLVGYWEIAPGGTRWNYYRKNALGHNTLVINPTTGANQIVGAYAGKIEQSINNPGGGYTILDMTDAYLENAVSVKRGFAYLDREQVLIRDEYTLKAPGKTYWQMHTKADVAISKDGKIATLTLNGKTLLVKLFDENGSDLKFATMAAKPYDAELTEGENVNEGVTKLYILADGVQTGVISVLLTPPELEDPEIKALANWNEYDFSGVCEHNYESVTTEPTCTEDGETVYTCTLCGGSYTEIIPSEGHDYEAVVTDPTCTKEGYTTYTCHCGDSYVADETYSLGHDVVLMESSAPTCELNGYEYYACSRCGGQEYTIILESTGHNYVDGTCENCGEADPNVKPSTPSTPGWSSWLEKLFGFWWGAKCDHTYTSVVTDPSCTDKGYTTHTCTKCGDCYKDSYVNATGHDYVDGSCIHCGKTEDKKPGWGGWFDWF